MSDNTKLTLDDMSELGINDKFWFEDISILYNPQRFIEFIPTEDMSLAEKLNTAARYGFIYINNINYIFR